MQLARQLLPGDVIEAELSLGIDPMGLVVDSGDRFEVEHDWVVDGIECLDGPLIEVAWRSYQLDRERARWVPVERTEGDAHCWLLHCTIAEPYDRDAYANARTS
jgi:hypothetical protein